jgi:hypothetical protein
MVKTKWCPNGSQPFEYWFRIRMVGPFRSGSLIPDHLNSETQFDEGFGFQGWFV